MGDRSTVRQCYFKFSISHEWMIVTCYQEASVQVDFKIEPTFIPSTAIKRLEIIPHGSGGLGDVWKCSMSTPSGTRPVSLQTDTRHLIIYHNLGCCQIHQSQAIKR
jgi:hypothetical protein